MSGEESVGPEIPVKEFDERTLNAARLYSLLRQECGIEDPWHIMAVSICALEQMHTKDSWEFVLTNKRDIEDVGHVFEQSNTPDEFRAGLIKLKEQDLMERLEKQALEEGLNP